MRSGYVTCSLFLSVTIAIAGGSTPSREDIPKYIATISNPSANAKSKAEAADMIAKRGAISARDVRDAVEPLKKLAQMDKDAGVRKSAVLAIANIAPDSSSTVPMLIGILTKDSAEEVKLATVRALGQYGPEAKSALPAIRNFGKTLDKKQQGPIRNATKAIQGNY